MTTINRLVRKPNLEEEDLFVIWSYEEGRTRSLSPDAMAEYIQGITSNVVSDITYHADLFTITYTTGDTAQIQIDRPLTGEAAPEGLIQSNGSRLYIRTYLSGSIKVTETYFNQYAYIYTGWTQTASFSEAV